jgi:restriction system protein
MDFEEHPLLHFADLVAALLRAAGDRAATLDDAARRLARDLDLAHEDPPVSGPDMIAHLERARHHLAAARLIEPLDDGRFRITPRGRSLLHDHAGGIDDTVLMAFPEFRAWMDRNAVVVPQSDARVREFQRGWAAQQEGHEFTDNPYAADTAQHAAWEDGWMEALRQRGSQGA